MIENVTVEGIVFMRLDKYLANSGVGTRSEVKTLVKKKLIKVNGEIVKSPSVNVDEGKDVVTYRDEPIVYKEFYYVLLNIQEAVWETKKKKTHLKKNKNS